VPQETFTDSSAARRPCRYLEAYLLNLSSPQHHSFPLSIILNLFFLPDNSPCISQRDITESSSTYDQRDLSAMASPNTVLLEPYCILCRSTIPCGIWDRPNMGITPPKPERWEQNFYCCKSSLLTLMLFFFKKKKKSHKKIGREQV
jgi:hypothetical protein